MTGTVTKTKIYEFQLPTWAVCYFANGDIEGLTDEDIQNVKDFENELIEEQREINAEHFTLEYPDNIDYEKYFSYFNCLNNLGSDVIDLKVHFFKSWE